jgi:DNA-binding CsgD family transcriptional regulator
MTRLSHRQWDALVDFIRGLDGVTDVDGLAAHVTGRLRRVVPAPIVTLNEITPATGRIRAWADPVELVDVRRQRGEFARHMADHPVLRHFARTADTRPRMISDFLTARRFEAGALYAEYYRPLGTRDQMVVRLPSGPGVVVGVALSRPRRDFAESDRLALDLVRPHLAVAYRQVEALARARAALILAGRATEAAAHALILVEPDGAMDFLTPSAAAWLEKFFGRWGPARRPPAPLAAWLRRAEAVHVTEHAAARLIVRAFRDHGQTLLLVSRQPTQLDARSLTALGLTRREAEVLARVAEGRTNAQVAADLGARPRTIAKHMQRIFDKLGVGTRTAAAAVARGAPAGARPSA